VAVGYCDFSGNAIESSTIRWTPETGSDLLIADGHPGGVNDDGSVIVGRSTNLDRPGGFRWTSTAGRMSLGEGRLADDTNADGTVVAVAALVVVMLLALGLNTEVFQRFWEPVFRSNEPLFIAMAHPIVYHPSGRALKLSEQNLPPQDIPMQRAIQVAPKELNGSDLVPVVNQYVGFGDMIAANEVTSMLTRKSQTVRVRLASNIEFADLRNVQTLLIGAVTNRWTLEMQQAWRFRFSWTPDTRAVIVDTQATPEGGRHWSIVSNDDGSAPEDYILVCRIHSPSTGGWLIAGAGLKQFGTEAAGRLLADPDQLGAILRRLPAGWESKNLQLVLHARVMRNTPALPDVVASYVW